MTTCKKLTLLHIDQSPTANRGFAIGGVCSPFDGILVVD